MNLMLISYHENENLTVNQRQTYLNKFTKSFFCKIFNNNDKKVETLFTLAKKVSEKGSALFTSLSTMLLEILLSENPFGRNFLFMLKFFTKNIWIYK